MLIAFSQVEGILAQGTDIETWLVGLVWGGHVPSSGSPQRSSSPFGNRMSMHSSYPHASLPPQVYNTPMPGSPSFPPGLHTPEFNEKYDVIKSAIAREEEGDKAYDPERDGTEAPQRPFCLTHAVCISLAMVLVVVVEMACVASKSILHKLQESRV